MPTCRLSNRGMDAVRRWVANRLSELADRPPNAGPIQALQDADLDDRLVVATSYAYADVPVGTTYDLAFSCDDGRRVRPEPTSLVLEHIVWEQGVPRSALEHGHKHVVAFRIDGALPAGLAALPVADDLEAIGFSERAGICAAADWDAVRRGRLIAVLRGSLYVLRADLESGASGVVPGLEDLANRIRAGIDTLENGELPDRGDMEALLAYHGPIHRACLDLGRSRQFDGILSLCPPALEDAFGAQEFK